MEVRQKVNSYNIKMTAGEVIEIKIGGNVVYTVEVGTGKEAIISFSYNEEMIQ